MNTKQFVNVSLLQFVTATTIYYLSILILGRDEKGVKCLPTNSGFAYM